MDETTYKDWLPLHDRWSKGEPLTPDEQAVYEAGCAAIDAKQTLPGRLQELKEIRDRADVLEAQHTIAVTEYNVLRAEIAALETRLGESTRQLLGVSGKA